MNEDPFALLDLRVPVQDQVRRQVVAHGADRFSRVQSRGNGHDIVGGQTDGIRIAAPTDTEKGGDLLARLDASCTLAQFVHRSDDVDAGCKRHARKPGE